MVLSYSVVEGKGEGAIDRQVSRLFSLSPVNSIPARSLTGPPYEFSQSPPPPIFCPSPASSDLPVPSGPPLPVFAGGGGDWFRVYTRVANALTLGT